MRKVVNIFQLGLIAILILGFRGSVFAGSAPSVNQALKLAPIQKGVDYDRPSDQEIPKCKISPKRINGQLGWIVEDGNGKILRRFVDTNGDNVVDLWCYYKDGEEIYRDFDSNNNGKADQYRWLNSAGTRWGLDPNEDGVIDSWKTISAEEVSAEIVAALATKDYDQYAQVALTAEDLENLGLGPGRQEALKEKQAAFKDGFRRAADRQKSLTSESQWVQFSAGRPGTVPAGTDDSTQDLKVYENVVAIVETGGRHSEVLIGTLVQVGDVWKAVDLPVEVAEGQSVAQSSTFFHPSPGSRPEGQDVAAGDGPQKILDELARLDEELQKSGNPTPELIAKRAELLEKIAAKTSRAEDRNMWIRQLADMLGAAVQMDQCPDGIERLKALHEKLKNEKDQDLAAYVRFTQLTAEHASNLQGTKARDLAKIQAEWQSTLEKFLSDYPATPVSAEAMLQLAIGEEFAGQEEAAVKWYDRVSKEFPETPAGKKALGAQTRLKSEGKTITLAGRTTQGGQIQLNQFRGKTVLIQYWATWSEPAKGDMQILKGLLAKYDRDFAVLGVNLDNNRQDLTDFLQTNKLPWPQIFEEGGLDSPPANQLGILTVPTMILVDPQGRVVNRNIQAAEIEKELKKLIKIGESRSDTRR
jgi:thiol-disulfide isomerase/thioredoxin